MLFSILALSGLSALTAANAIPSAWDLEGRQIPSKPCSQYTGGVHVIATPGEGSADPPYGLLGSLARSILNAIPGSTNVSVPYNHADPVGTRQADGAAATLMTYIQQYQQSCPYTRMVLLGYSSGAIATMNVLCGETNPPYPRNTAPLSIPKYSGNLIATIVYGDETRTAGADYNYGTCAANGEHPRTAQVQGNCEKWSGILRSYCDNTDPRCCTTGTDPNAHYTYPKYDSQATSYVVSQFRKFGN